MVKLRVINGGKHIKEPDDQKVRLFSACTVIDNFRGHDSVRLNWIYLQRKFPVARYEKLIDGYAQVNERVRSYFEEYVNELFTEQEIELLSQYVATVLGANCTVKEEPVPLSSLFMPMPFQEIKPVGGKGFYKPVCAGREGLPFEVRGYYDLGKCPPSIAIHGAVANRGIRFLTECLKNLGIDPLDHDSSLREAVEKVYDDFGLLVEKGSNLQERTKQRAEVSKLRPSSEN